MNLKARRLLKAGEGLGEGAVVVEIGCVRNEAEVPSDGYSTVYLGRRAKRRAWEFHSVDIDPAAIHAARSACEGLPVALHQADGEEWLRRFRRPIDLLYLDGAADPEQAVRQYRAAKLAHGATVVIDDAQPIVGDGLNLAQGKASTILTLLEQDGFRVKVYETEPGYRMAVATWT